MNLATATDWREMCPAEIAAEADDWKRKSHIAIANSVMVVGQGLRAMKAKMAHGCFGAWCDQEMGLNSKKVNDLMVASELLEQQAEDTPLMSLPPRTLAVLQRSGSAAALNGAVEMLEGGQRVTEATAKELSAKGDGTARRGPRVSTTMRVLGVLNDERVGTLSAFIKGRNAAMEKSKAILKVLEMDPKTASMSGPEKMAARDAGKADPLVVAWCDAVDAAFEAQAYYEEYHSWTSENPCDPPAIDDPLWDEVFSAEGSPRVVYESLREWTMKQAELLAGHRDPEAALRLWMDEISNPRGREASWSERMLSNCLEPWESWVQGWLGDMLVEGRAEAKARAEMAN